MNNLPAYEHAQQPTREPRMTLQYAALGSITTADFRGAFYRRPNRHVAACVLDELEFIRMQLRGMPGFLDRRQQDEAAEEARLRGWNYLARGANMLLRLYPDDDPSAQDSHRADLSLLYIASTPGDDYYAASLPNRWLQLGWWDSEHDALGRVLPGLRSVAASLIRKPWLHVDAHGNWLCDGAPNPIPMSHSAPLVSPQLLGEADTVRLSRISYDPVTVPAHETPVPVP